MTLAFISAVGRSLSFGGENLLQKHRGETKPHFFSCMKSETIHYIYDCDMTMKIKKNTFRIPIGFTAALVFLVRADPVLWSIITGLIIMVCGEAIRFISAGTLIKYEGVTRSGIYGYVRNPLYTGSFLIGLGACFMGRDFLFTLFFLIAFPAIYLQIIKREEKSLIERYGKEYELYTQEVPRFWPGKVVVSDIIKESSLFLAIKNGEYRAVLGVVAILVVMVLKMIF